MYITTVSLLKDDINQIKNKIKNLNQETNELTDKRNVTNDPMEDKLTLFRQQAAIIARFVSCRAHSVHAHSVLVPPLF